MTDDVQASDDTDGGLDPAAQRAAVRKRYADAATATDSAGCCGTDSEPESCCGDATTVAPEQSARDVGYSDGDVDAVEPGANLGLGCGNPTAIARLDEGEDVLDLGSGGGFDCFLAAREVGPSGRVVGVDMTPKMVETARENAVENDASNVEFRLGEIEHLPVADQSVDVILSNCVVNLSPDKPQVFRETFRALRPGGRLAISDVVAVGEIPARLRDEPDSLAACVAGASPAADLESMLTDAGFVDVSVDYEERDDPFGGDHDHDEVTDALAAATIEATKPAE
jgi:SAM-dependent methyltransferase